MLISVSNLTFAYDGSYDNVFEDVSLQFDTAWRLGFIGRNGRGKTTFLKLLMGEHEYRGSISSPVDFLYFPFEVGDISRTTSEIIAGIAPEAMEWELERELSLLEVASEVLTRPFSTLSNGERTKALLAALFLRENSFLLIDEPTNHLDAAARETVSRYLKRKEGFLLVSHDRALLDSCVDHIISINRANIEIQRGNFSTWQHNRELRDSFELAENERLEKDIARLDAAAKRAAGWSDKTEKGKYNQLNSGLRVDRGYIGHKSAKMMKRAKSTQRRNERAAEEKSGLLRNLETAEPLIIRPLDHHAPRLAELEDIAVTYDGHRVFSPTSFCIENGTRLALSGKNGSGKSSILKLLCGEDIPHSGQIRLASGLKISYVPQDTAQLKGNLRDYAEEYGIDESLFKSILRKLDFSRVQFEKELEDFSGGQKKKVLLARSLCEQAHIYVWDEPLNFIDVLSRIQIEELLLEYKPTMIFVEHDSTFTNKVATAHIRLE